MYGTFLDARLGLSARGGTVSEPALLLALLGGRVGGMSCLIYRSCACAFDD